MRRMKKMKYDRRFEALKVKRYDRHKEVKALVPTHPFTWVVLTIMGLLVLWLL
jgi:hypothetical protein